MGRPSKGRATAAVAPTIILVRPQLGENIGMAARAMLNCGLSALRLVAPRDGWPNPKAERAASGADVVLNEAQVFASVGEAVADLERVVATTARNRELSQRILTPRRAAEEMRAWMGRGEKVGILFGPERTGLTNDDMVRADTALSIPLNPQFSSLNIAQAVLLVAYEWAVAGRRRRPNACPTMRRGLPPRRSSRTSSTISSARSTSRDSCATKRCGRPWCSICGPSCSARR